MKKYGIFLICLVLLSEWVTVAQNTTSLPVTEMPHGLREKLSPFINEVLLPMFNDKISSRVHHLNENVPQLVMELIGSIKNGWNGFNIPPLYFDIIIRNFNLSQNVTKENITNFIPNCLSVSGYESNINIQSNTTLIGNNIKISVLMTFENIKSFIYLAKSIVMNNYQKDIISKLEEVGINAEKVQISSSFIKDQIDNVLLSTEKYIPLTLIGLSTKLSKHGQGATIGFIVIISLLTIADLVIYFYEPQFFWKDVWGFLLIINILTISFLIEGLFRSSKNEDIQPLAILCLFSSSLMIVIHSIFIIVRLYRYLNNQSVPDVAKLENTGISISSIYKPVTCSDCKNPEIGCIKKKGFCQPIFFGENGVTLNHFDGLSGFIKITGNDDKDYADLVKYFVPENLWTRLVIPTLELVSVTGDVAEKEKIAYLSEKVERMKKDSIGIDIIYEAIKAHFKEASDPAATKALVEQYIQKSFDPKKYMVLFLNPEIVNEIATAPNQNSDWKFRQLNFYIGVIAKKDKARMYVPFKVNPSDPINKQNVSD